MRSAPQDPIRLVAPAPEHKADWRRLYQAYCAFYQLAWREATGETVWAWLIDPAQVLEGLLALDPAGRPIGLAHFRAMPRPSRGAMAGFLDDLFVAPEARGGPAGRMLIEAVSAIGRARGWTVLRWLTADDNYRARGLYDQLATRTGWITYEIGLEAR